MLESEFARVQRITRRHFLGGGLGAVALAAIGKADAPTNVPMSGPMTPRPPMHAAKAKRVISIHMAGAPPQQDLFDPKPKLAEWNGLPCPPEFLEKERFAFIKGHPKILASPYTFAQHGQSGANVSELLPHFAKIVDDVAIVRSMHTEQFNHAPAQLFLFTGSARPERPAMGAWVTYGLGTENADLPGYVVLVSGGNSPDAGKSVWGSGFLPGVHQGVQCRSAGEPVLFASNPKGMDRDLRRATLDAINAVNRERAAASGDLDTLTRIEQYELAFRMQMSVPEAMDIAREPAHILEMYGAEPGKATFANNCLLARRLLERGVRFVQLFDWGWDVHGTNPGDDIMTQLPLKCRQTDRPSAALVADLKRRGLLEDTLVIWTGEFGRTPMNEERNGSKFLGRDHHPHCFTIWLAGAGVKRGVTYGATDEMGYRVAADPVHIHDLQATILHLLGMDHEKLTYRFQGRDFRLTDVHGKVVHGLLS